MANLAGGCVLYVERLCAFRSWVWWCRVDAASAANDSQRSSAVPTGYLLAVVVFLIAYGVHALVECELGAH